MSPGTLIDDRSAEDALLYDDLTGLPNRLLQRAHLVHALRRATRNRTQVAVLFLDVDDFTDLNRRLGRELADQVLIVLGARIAASLRGTDLTARLDNDEFVVVCEDLSNDRDLAMLARRVTDAVCTPMRVGDAAVEVRVSVGTALSSGIEGAGELLSLANARMARCKARRHAG